MVSYLVTLLITFPFIWMLVLSFKTNSDILTNPMKFPETLDLVNYVNAVTTLNLLILYKNTFVIAAVSIIVLLSITFASSYCLSRLVFKSAKLRNGLFFYLLLGMAIPKFILLFPVFRITLLFNLFGTYTSLILPYIALEISFNTLLLYGFLRGFPQEIEEAAIIDGCGLFKLCTSIVLPIIKPVLATVFIFDILHIWNEFPFAMTLIRDEAMYTIPLGISMFRSLWSVDYGAIVAASVLVIIPQLIFYGFFQKYIIAGMTAGAVKG